VTGVDKDPQPRYPYRFVQADAIAYVLEHGTEFDFIHASPPCQHDTDCQRIRGNAHPDLIAPTRAALEAMGRPWVIENVRGAVPKLRDPVMLCGQMFRALAGGALRLAPGGRAHSLWSGVRPDGADGEALQGGGFVHGDAIEYLLAHGDEYDLVHASPPCQLYNVPRGLACCDTRSPLF
jgi:site-specific DNA-cytosine methylase